MIAVEFQLIRFAEPAEGGRKFGDGKFDSTRLELPLTALPQTVPFGQHGGE